MSNEAPGSLLSPTLSPNEVIEVEILRLSSGGGRGVAKHNDFVVFVPLAAPGDKLKVQVKSVKKTFAEAEVVEAIEFSESRKDPECEYFKECGGCTLQMISMEEQHRQKEGFLDFAIKRVKDEETLVEPIQASPKDFRYRNRIQIHQEGRSVGFHRKESHSLVKIKDCLITDERVTKEFFTVAAANKRRRVELALNQEGKVLVGDKKLGADQALFSQVNTGLNELLVDYVMTEAGKLSDLKMIHDLYAGSGNFSFPFAKLFKESKVVAVELSKGNVAVAKERNKNKNLKFTALDVGLFLSTTKDQVDLALVDPPRKGMSKDVVEGLLEVEPDNVFYISCNLASGSRDLNLLSSKYRLVKAKPFDMFPQTDHVEAFFHLKLK